MMPPIGVAIVGCGRSSDLHEPGYRDERDARIVTICDVKRTRVRAKALCSSTAAPRAQWIRRR